MSVLAIDTSSRRRVVAVLAGRDGALQRAEVRGDAPVGVVLPRMVVELLHHDVEAVVVATGPGSYTGLRAGMAAALGAARGRAVPLHGIGSLEVVAAGWRADGVARGCVAVDAGRGFAHVAVCHAGPDGWRLDGAHRVAIDAAELRGAAVASTDDLPVPGVIAVDSAAALAAAVPRALGAPALTSRGLAAQYLE
ncbi:MAG: tRNA (adenosine(37)-N6)-threonylcarbamoyltransferase complex dimerization subunit type 1 TsaB [Candidatus Dormibacteraeota bacterium]|nr:tRNA (adenosine(37)-N6)-threonylcarbamoyltransferase complex dimerization subunit type 1 TsaB [Candidatus Dormibacteraeota bacterium]